MVTHSFVLSLNFSIFSALNVDFCIIGLMEDTFSSKYLILFSNKFIFDSYSFLSERKLDSDTLDAMSLSILSILLFAADILSNISLNTRSKFDKLNRLDTEGLDRFSMSAIVCCVRETVFC